MATRDEIYAAIRNADKAGDADSVQKLGTYLQTMGDGTQVHTNTPAMTAKIDADPISQDAKSGPSYIAEYLRELPQQAGNALAGAVRGAGSIGATIAYPFDKAEDLIRGDRGPTLSGLVTGQQPLSRNEERRKAMDAGLAQMGADTNSPAYKVFKMGAEVAGTAGTGSAIAQGATRVPAIASAAPNLLRAVETGGMSGGNMMTRMAGGAINGGASAGLIDPSQAATGAALGSVLPVAVNGAGRIGEAVGNAFRGPEQSPELVAAIQKAQAAGYVIPPSQANPNFLNKTLEGLAGKVTTAQKASAMNAKVTDAATAADLGLSADAAITPEALAALRAKAGEAYAAVAGKGKFNAAGADLPAAANVQKGYDKLLITPKTEVDAKDLVGAWKQANADKNAYYTAYGRDAQPETLKKAEAAAANAKSIHDFLKTQIGAQEGKTADQLLADVAAGRLSVADLLKQTLAGVERSKGAAGSVAALDAARAQIAKSYAAEKAMNPATGTIDANKLASMQKGGKLLTGGMKDAADFAGRFPKAAQVPEKIGSQPGSSPVDWLASLMTGNKLAAVATLGARPIARSIILSPAVQNRLIQSQAQPGAINQLLSNDQLAQLAYRLSPGALADR